MTNQTRTEPLDRLAAVMGARWFHVGRPWADRPGLIYAGSEDPHAGTFVVDAGTWADEMFFGEASTMDAGALADRIVAEHNAAPSLIAEAREAARLRSALDELFAVTPERFYIEARVGSDNYRGEEVRFIVDRRGQEIAWDTGREYENDDANERVGRIIAAVNALRAALVKPSETRTCPNCGDVLTGEEWEGHRLSEGVKP